MAAADAGDMALPEFRDAGLRALDWAIDYLGHLEQRPVGSASDPGQVRSSLCDAAPEEGVPFGRILEEFERVVMPGVTHWNHPGFMAYFPSSGSGPGILGEFVTAVLNQQAMSWSTSPAANELEQVVLDWLRQMLGLPGVFSGVCHDGGSSSNLHALAAALAASVPDLRARGLAGRSDVVRPCVYASAQAHASVAKATVLLGMGLEAFRTVPVDDRFRMDPAALAARVAGDRKAGWMPIAAVATVGTTSTGSIDPVAAVADVCAREGLWLHVDASYGGAAAIVPGQAAIFDGVARAFSARNRRPSASPLSRTSWMVIRYFGAAGLRARIAAHLELARSFAAWIDASPDFQRLAPVALSVVCFRARPANASLDPKALDRLNEELPRRFSARGEALISSTRLHGRLALRLAIGHVRTSGVHVARAWDGIRSCLEEIRQENPALTRHS